MDRLLRNSRIKLTQGLLFWREAGGGTPVIFLHGAWNDSSEWVSVMGFLSQNFHCFAPDLLGFGESENPNIHHSIDLQVECISEFLQALKLEKVFLVGHSLGAWIAASYALKYPEQVDGLVLLTPEGVKIEGQEKQKLEMQRLVKRPLLFYQLLRSLRPLAKVLGLRETIEQDWHKRQILLQYSTACQLLFKRKQAEIEADFLENRLHLMERPVLILQGGQDLLDAVVKSQTYAQLTPKVELKIISHVGKNLPESSPGLVAEDIGNFIRGK